MTHADQIESRATIAEVLDHGAYRAELANGHACIARPLKGQNQPYAPGDIVLLSFHPADLSRARILSPAK